MIIKVSNKNIKEFATLSLAFTKANIKTDLITLNIFIGQELLKILQEDMTKKKTGRLYGSHRASAAGESPARRTGNLADTSKYKSSTNNLELGYTASYGAYLEYGTSSIDPRPNVKNLLKPANILYKERLHNVFSNFVRGVK